MLIGLVGKTNVGKSTFFKALTLAEVAIAPYPFTTIEKNEGIAFVKVDCVEKEFRTKCKPKYGYCVNSERFIPVKIIDVAGLVPGAHTGKGKGNQFLDDLREADMLIHVLDASGTSDENGRPTSGYDPCFDVKFLQDEIDLWMHAIIAENWKNFARKISTTGKKATAEMARMLSGLKINEEMVKDAMKKLNLSERIVEWNDEQLLAFVCELRKKSKPMIIAANKVDLPRAADNIEKLKKTFPEMMIISCSAESELALREAAKHGLINYVPGENDFEIKKELTAEQQKALNFVKEKILKKYGSTGIQQCLNEAVFDFMKCITVYPVENEKHFSDSHGNVLPDAFLMPQNSTALDLAYKIHTSIGENFIAAIDSRTGKRLAKDYKLKDNDVIRIMMR